MLSRSHLLSLSKELLVHRPPITPFIINLLAIQQHATKENAGRSATMFLPIVYHERFSYFYRERAVQLMLEFVDIVTRRAFAQVLVQFSIVVSYPSFDPLPGMCNWWRRWESFAEILHLDLGGRLLLYRATH